MVRAIFVMQKLVIIKKRPVISIILISQKKKDEHINHLSKKDLFRRMHVYHNGKLISGSESFLVLWDTMPKWRYLSSLLRIPILRQLWKIVYEVLALFLYIKNKSRAKG